MSGAICLHCQNLDSALGVHRAGCPNAKSGSGNEFLPLETIEGGLRVTHHDPYVVMAIDPGTTKSAYLFYDCAPENSMARFPWPVLGFGIVSNDELRDKIEFNDFDAFAIEMVQHFGMPVGAEVFETCTWIGAFEERCRMTNAGACRRRYTRQQIKLHHCNSNKANDGTIRQALIDRFGGRVRAIGTVKNPGPLRGVANDVWSALAIAVKFADDYRTPF